MASAYHPTHAAIVRMGSALQRDGHESATLERLAERIAVLHGLDYAGDYDPARHDPATTYFIPEQTLDAGRAAELGITDVAQLFGGIVPAPFIATKVISHPALAGGRNVPVGWSRALTKDLGDAVLSGRAFFDRADAHAALHALLPLGRVRLKPAGGVGGLGQSVVGDAASLDAVLDAFDDGVLEAHGMVLEQNLEDVVTYSVGTLRIGRHEASYCGTQRLTPNTHGEAVYGGSELLMVRGGFDALLQIDMDAATRRGVEQARHYDDAVRAAYPGLLASRRNYDVARGTDRAGAERSGVLEQSWRIGGATPAELAGLEAFDADPALQVVRTCSHEAYTLGGVPSDAVSHYQAVDPRVGPLTKYSRVLANGSQARNR